MRKRLITPTTETVRSRGEGWLDVESAAVVEVTSEDDDSPVESAFVSGEARGWRAAVSGSQTIRLVFGQPQRLRRISLVFEERETARTQEFVLRWSPDGGTSFREIVRQQWNFSPPETRREDEEYQVELSNVTILELIIVPNMSGGAAPASLLNLRFFFPVTPFFFSHRIKQSQWSIGHEGLLRQISHSLEFCCETRAQVAVCKRPGTGNDRHVLTN